MKAVPLLISVFLLGLAATASGAGQTGLIVSHHEEFRDFNLRGTARNLQGDNDSLAAESSATVLSFNALGRSYDLQLVDNSRLLSGDARQVLANNIQLYRGHLAGADGSWARITVIDGIPRGVIWDGEQLIAIEGPGDNALGSASPIIYRLADTYVIPGTMSCGNGGAMISGAAMYEGLVRELTAARAVAAGATSEIQVSTIGDFDFFNIHGAGSAAAIITRLSVVDGIFSNAVGVQITLPTPEVFTDNVADPFTETDANELLLQLGAYRAANSAHNTAGLTHLYTGKDLDLMTVGIAYTDALCLFGINAAFSSGLSQGNISETTDALIAAHEIGHNFGAPHDGDAEFACGAEPDDTFLMAPSITGSMEFSACSISEMQLSIAAASCITPLPSTDVSVALSGTAPTVLLGNSATLTFDVANVGTDDATNVAADITLPNTVTFVSIGSSAGSCTSGAGTANCQIGTIAGGAAATVTVSSISDAVGSATFDATVSADVDDNASNDQVAVLVTVDPAIDLLATAPAARTVTVDTSGSVSVTIENLSAIDATDVALSLTADAGVRPDTATWTAGSCTITGQQIDCTATILGPQATSSLSLGVTALTIGQQNYSLSVTANEVDRDTANNNASGSFDVAAAVVVGGGGGGSSDSGGGSFGAVILALLGTLLLNRRRRFC
jgi:hypothetical protein